MTRIKRARGSYATPGSQAAGLRNVAVSRPLLDVPDNSKSVGGANLRTIHGPEIIDDMGKELGREVGHVQRSVRCPKPPVKTVSIVTRTIGNLLSCASSWSQNEGKTPKMFPQVSKEPSRCPDSTAVSASQLMGNVLRAVFTASLPNRETLLWKPTTFEVTSSNSNSGKTKSLLALGLQAIGAQHPVVGKGSDKTSGPPETDAKKEEPTISPANSSPPQNFQQQGEKSGSPSTASPAPGSAKSGPPAPPEPAESEEPPEPPSNVTLPAHREMKEELSAPSKETVEEGPREPFNTWAVFGICLLLAIGLYIFWPYIIHPVEEETWYDCTSSRDKICVKDLSMLWMLGCFLTKFIVMFE